jgi:hypothetical protein
MSKRTDLGQKNRRFSKGEMIGVVQIVCRSVIRLFFKDFVTSACVPPPAPPLIYIAVLGVVRIGHGLAQVMCEGQGAMTWGTSGGERARYVKEAVPIWMISFINQRIVLSIFALYQALCLQIRMCTVYLQRLYVMCAEFLISAAIVCFVQSWTYC